MNNVCSIMNNVYFIINNVCSIMKNVWYMYFIMNNVYYIMIYSMNDLIAVDKDKFYITQWLYNRDLAKSYIEMFLFQHLGKVFFYDGSKAREVASNLFISNGINISPDKS